MKHLLRLCSIIFFVISAFVASATFVQAQTPSELRIESTRGVIGGKINVPLRLPKLDSTHVNVPLTLEGRFILSNSSVFFPLEWQFPQGAQNLASRLTRVNDSTYTFVVQSRRTANLPNDTLAYLRGELLAGSDTVTAISMRELRFTDARGSRTIPTTTGTIFNDFVDVVGPFVRFAQLQMNAPNPVLRGSPTSWAYTIDVPSDVVFTIYNLAGEEVERIERKQIRGSHVETWNPRPNIAAGAYFVRFTSNSGDVLQRFVIQ